MSYIRCATVYCASGGVLNQILHLKFNQNADLHFKPVISADSEMKVLVLPLILRINLPVTSQYSKMW